MSRIRGRVAVPLLLTLVYSCGALLGQRINSGTVEEFPLWELKTFAFLQQQREPQDGLKDQPTAEAELRRLLLEAFREAGYVPTTENPDFVVAFYAKEYLKTTYRAEGYIRTGDFATDHIEAATLVVDVISLERKQAVWTGAAQANLTPTNRSTIAKKASSKLVKRFAKDARKLQKKHSKNEPGK